VVVAVAIVVVAWAKSPFCSACLELRRSGEAAMLARGLSLLLTLRGRPRRLREADKSFGSVVGSAAGMVTETTSFAAAVVYVKSLVSCVGVLGLRPRFRLLSPISVFGETRERKRKSANGLWRRGFALYYWLVGNFNWIFQNQQLFLFFRIRILFGPTLGPILSLHLGVGLCLFGPRYSSSSSRLPLSIDTLLLTVNILSWVLF
jgi:hypothetical protein